MSKVDKALDLWIWMGSAIVIAAMIGGCGYFVINNILRSYI